MADLLSLAIRNVEAMSRASVLKVRLRALNSTLSSNNSCTGELESQVSSENSEFDAARGELESTKRRVRMPLASGGSRFKIKGLNFKR